MKVRTKTPRIATLLSSDEDGISVLAFADPRSEIPNN